MREVLWRVWKSPSGRLGMIAALIVILSGIAAPLIASHMPNQIDVAARLTPPSANHWFGTDHLGRDLYSRSLYGTRIAVSVALAVTATALVLGVLLGVTAAYAPPAIERTILACFDIVSSFPSLILALALVAVLGPGLLNIILLVTVVFIPQFGRVARAQTLTVKERPFLEAERALGASGPRIMLVHVLPNIIGPVLADVGLRFVFIVLLLSGLSFLGLGVQPPEADWGSLVRENIGGLPFGAPAVMAPSFAIASLTIAVNLLIDNLPQKIRDRSE